MVTSRMRQVTIATLERHFHLGAWARYGAYALRSTRAGYGAAQPRWKRKIVRRPRNARGSPRCTAACSSRHCRCRAEKFSDIFGDGSSRPRTTPCSAVARMFAVWRADVAGAIASRCGPIHRECSSRSCTGGSVQCAPSAVFCLVRQDCAAQQADDNTNATLTRLDGA